MRNRPPTGDSSFIEQRDNHFDFRNTRSTPVFKYHGGSVLFSKSTLPREDLRAPSVGLYQISRLLDDIRIQKDDIFGHSLTSSFKSSGRLKPLMGDAIHYATMREGEKTSKVGPGSYSHADSWGVLERSTVDRVQTSRGVRGPGDSNYIGYDRPWSQPNTAGQHQRRGVAQSVPYLKKSSEFNAFDSKELQSDIDSVRKLPSYE